MELYLQQNANKVDAVAKEKEAGQKQKENRQVLKVRFQGQSVRPQLKNLTFRDRHSVRFIEAKTRTVKRTTVEK